MDVGDLLYRTNCEPELEDPSNNNSRLHDAALLCVTDLVDCCESPQSHGDWLYPNGNIVQFDGFPLNAVFRANRGQNEIRNGRQFYGSVCLWHRYSPKNRDHFHCEIPNATNPSVNQTLYTNIKFDIIQ